MRCRRREKHKVGLHDIFRGKYQWRPLSPYAGTVANKKDYFST